ncbi:MAG: DUF3630 family protein [Pseudomonadota bacterium]|nr:DUF3630 family protein [Pseudomonadota bacterium]
MQQLTPHDIARALVCETNIVRWIGPMPQTQQQAVGLCHTIARLLGARQGDSDWGADRLQVRLSAEDFEAVLNVEWLCEAIWLEPVGASTAHISKADMLQNLQLKLRQALK